jgi:DNA-binding response OmpR family regulator
MKRRILVISADQYHTRLIRGHLDEAGFDVQVLESGEKAIKAVRVAKPSLILLDWKLPDLSSLAIIRMIRADEQISRLPLILMGREMRADERLIGFESGADLCLDEPFHPREFVARVRALLRRVSPAEV